MDRGNEPKTKHTHTKKNNKTNNTISILKILQNKTNCRLFLHMQNLPENILFLCYYC